MFGKFNRFFVIIVLMLPLLLWGQTRYQLYTGARPMGMGETYTAVANDGFAAYWNPAGLSLLKQLELNTSYSNPYGIPGLKSGYFGAAYTRDQGWGVGASYFHFGFGDDELEYKNDKIQLGFGLNVFKGLSLGASFKWLSMDASLDDLSEGQASGPGFDIGALYALNLDKIEWLDRIQFGAVGHDIGGTKITFESSNQAETILDQNIRYGAAFFLKNQIRLGGLTLTDPLLAVDVDDRIHLGAETWINDWIGIRAGYQKDRDTSEDPVYSFGGSVKLPKLPVQLDYGFVMHPVLSSTHLVSLSLTDMQPPVRILDRQLNDVYASYYKTYVSAPFGNVILQNEYNQPIEATLSIQVDGYDIPVYEKDILLAANSKQSVEFQAYFPASILVDNQDQNVKQATIGLQYRIQNETKSTEKTASFTLYQKGAMTWNQPGKAAAFVTPLDPMVAWFARECTQSFNYKNELDLGHIETAMILYHAMGEIGCRYQDDPNHPFSTTETGDAIDFIQYPSEMLISRQGDCDDLTVLYCSLLQNRGIPTAFLTVNDHIWMMFDTGIHELNWGILPLDSTMILSMDQTLWIPVEVTSIGNNFQKAWQEGCEKYLIHKDSSYFAITKVADVAGIYPSANPELKEDRSPELPNNQKLMNQVTEDMTWLEKERTESAISRLKGQSGNNPSDLNTRNRLGILLAQQNKMDAATEIFKDILKENDTFAKALINLGNIYNMQGNFQLAEEQYLNAEPQGPSSGLQLNLAILYQFSQLDSTLSEKEQNDLQQKSEIHLAKAFNGLENDDNKALQLLGIASSEIDDGEKADYKDWIKQKASAVKKFIKDNAQKHLFNKSVKNARLQRQGVKRGEDHARAFVLYWAQ